MEGLCVRKGSPVQLFCCSEELLCLKHFHSGGLQFIWSLFLCCSVQDKNLQGFSRGKKVLEFSLISSSTQGSQQPSKACGEGPHHLEGDTMNINESFCHPRPEGKQRGNITATACQARVYDLESLFLPDILEISSDVLMP